MQASAGAPPRGTMAHHNINERRKAVAAAIASGHVNRALLAAQFSCSTGAIHADIIALTAPSLGASIYLQQKIRRWVRERDRFICQYCGRPGYTVEHVIPAALGGVAQPYNLGNALTVWVPIVPAAPCSRFQNVDALRYKPIDCTLCGVLETCREARRFTRSPPGHHRLGAWRGRTSVRH